MSSHKKPDEDTAETVAPAAPSLGQDYTIDHANPVDQGTVSDPGNSGAVTPAADTAEADTEADAKADADK